MDVIDKETKTKQLSNAFDGTGRFVIQDFDHKPAFSSFLPGIAGLHGIPMWVFYVNRGQAVCSFGVENKDHPILEFHSANIAYQDTGLKGFRTFLNAEREGERWQHEVFTPWNAKQVKRTMFIGMNDVEVQEINTLFGYQINGLFFTLPDEPFSGLVRQISIKNLLDSTLQIEVLDGLPGIVPYGLEDGALKHVGRTIEAWMQVDNLVHNLPFYHLKATPGDTADVHAIAEGNYALAFHGEGLLPAIVDPTIIFGRDTGHTAPHLFYEKGLEGMLAAQQILEGRTPCAFFAGKLTIPPGQEKELNSIFGYTNDLSIIQAKEKEFQESGYIDKKLKEARRLTEDLTDDIWTSSNSPEFDGYCRQTFLDNLLRGGYPVLLGGEQLLHVFARKHGDIERDYNYFVLPPEFYSQGNGNYRDVNQNRRNDPFFQPRAGEFNIRLFMSLIQADGYNPLVINGVKFSLPQSRLDELSSLVGDNAAVVALLEGEFTPGELLEALSDGGISLSPEAFFEKVFSSAQPHIKAEHGEGYWVDHWTYNLDLIESYLAIYPDKKAELFYDLLLPFYDNPHVVQPRSERFVEQQGKPMQLNAVVLDKEKEALLRLRSTAVNWARVGRGKGEVFRLPLISKLALLALIKFATLDPSGMGIFMEAGRPGWYDALNGLPGMFGSSMPETYELMRLVIFLKDVLKETENTVSLPAEAEILLNCVSDTEIANPDDFMDWDRRMAALEEYRQAILLGFDGRVNPVEFAPVLEHMQQSLESGIEKAHAFSKEIPPTYFIHKVTDYGLKGTQDKNGNAHIRVNGFKPEALPPFLEGPVRLMKISSKDQAQILAKGVRGSDLFDHALGMYKVNVSLASQPHGIGRARAFTPGWLENESIWMHMSFKYLLELLKAGLFEEYSDALQDHLPAFMDPEVYGRSPLENSSFIVSSVHPDKNYHGRGFVARLSGSTAEFLSMWVLMTAGAQPFLLVNGLLVLEFKPVLPGWLFTRDGTFSFRFLGDCIVTVKNPERVSTYEQGMRVIKIKLHTNGKIIDIKGSKIEGLFAEKVRSGEIDSIELFYELKDDIGER